MFHYAPVDLWMRLFRKPTRHIGTALDQYFQDIILLDASKHRANQCFRLMLISCHIESYEAYGYGVDANREKSGHYNTSVVSCGEVAVRRGNAGRWTCVHMRRYQMLKERLSGSMVESQYDNGLRILIVGYRLKYLAAVV